VTISITLVGRVGEGELENQLKSGTTSSNTAGKNAGFCEEGGREAAPPSSLW
jgi:hypothetical protein